jgi:hypothetical protein
MTGRDLIKFIIDNRLEDSKFCFQRTEIESKAHNWQPWLFLQENMFRIGRGRDLVILNKEGQENGR